MKRRPFLISVFETLFVFGLIIFFYEVGVSYFQPQWLHQQVTHLQEGVQWLSWLRNDTLGVIAFIVSVVSFFLARYLKNLKHENPDPNLESARRRPASS